MKMKFSLLFLATGMSLCAYANADEQYKQLQKRTNEILKMNASTEEVFNPNVLYIDKVTSKDATNTLLGECKYDENMRLTSFVNGFLGAGMAQKKIFVYADQVNRQPVLKTESILFSGMEMNPMRSKYEFYFNGLISGYFLQTPKNANPNINNDSDWKSVSRLLYRYSLNGNLNTYVEMSWDDQTPGDTIRKFEYKYDTAGRRIEESQYNYSGGGYALIARYKSEYDESTGLLKKYTTPASAIEYEYDALGNVSAETHYEIISSQEEKKMRIEYKHVGKNKTQEVYFSWVSMPVGDTFEYGWAKTMKYNWDYTALSKISKESKYYWITELYDNLGVLQPVANPFWALEQRINCTFENDLMTESLLSGTKGPTDSASVNLAKYTYAYNAAGQMSKYDGYMWDSKASKWMFKEAQVVAYDNLLPRKVMPTDAYIFFQNSHGIAGDVAVTDYTYYVNNNYDIDNNLIETPKEECKLDASSFVASYIQKEYIPVTSVALDKTELHLSTTGQGSMFDLLNVTIAPENATYRELIWWTTNDKVATVNAMGQVFGIGSGVCHVGCSTADGMHIAYATVEVNNFTPIDQITINASVIKTAEGAFVSSESNISEYNLYDATGRLVESVSNPGNAFNVTLPQRGVYVLVLNSENASSSYKIIK